MKESFADWYLRIVLTLIAAALCVIAVNPWLAPSSVQAGEAGLTAGDIQQAVTKGIKKAEPITTYKYVPMD